MIVANFFHIKSSNGLFHYGVDYVKEQQQALRKVLVRPGMASVARQALPAADVVACDLRRFLGHIQAARRQRDFVYTPTSHPMPFLSRQWIVVHDTFPFQGTRGGIKRLLLKASLASSNCRVAYINHSDAQRFVANELGVPADRQTFAPNRFPAAPTRDAAAPARNGRFRVGLVGTDSAKKNYGQLFDAVQESGASQVLSFRVYGHDTAYFREICQRFRGLDISLIGSDQTSLEHFFAGIDAIASAATQEGFGRPIAAALLGGIPCFLVECPVFCEFFSGGALFQTDASALAAALGQAAGAAPEPPRYVAPAAVVEAYRSANGLLGRLGASAA